MADWQQSFARRLGDLRDGWMHAFACAIDEKVLPAFGQMESFLVTNGFTVSTPKDGGAVRSFKFALGEDVYVIVSFRMHGPLEVEASNEVFVAANTDCKPRSECVPLQSVTANWAQRQFQDALDRLMEALEATAAEPVAEYA